LARLLLIAIYAELRKYEEMVEGMAVFGEERGLVGNI
jgi:hypothetical protein